MLHVVGFLYLRQVNSLCAQYSKYVAYVTPRFHMHIHKLCAEKEIKIAFFRTKHQQGEMDVIVNPTSFSIAQEMHKNACVFL